jgi:SH3 domain protein
MKGLLQSGLLVLALLATGAMAQTRYVSDELVITFRTGPGSQNAIVRNLTSGDRVEVLEVLEDQGYSRVRLANGDEGWVLTQYLQDEPTAQLRLAAATRDLAAERGRTAELAQRVDELETELAATAESLTETQSSAARVTAELDDVRSASASAIETRQQNATLRQRVADLTAAAEADEMEIDSLRRRERQNWFIIGAAVLLGGIIIGLIAPSLRPKRRSSW